MFELQRYKARVTSFHTRRENHGDTRVPAMSIGLELVMPNATLAELDAPLPAMFYEAPPGQDQLPGVEHALSRLRSDKLVGDIAIEVELKNYGVVLRPHPWDGEPDAGWIALGKCTINKVKLVDLLEGGNVRLKLHVGTSDIDADRLGRLGLLVDCEVIASLDAPKPEVVNETTAETLPEAIPPDVRQQQLDALGAGGTGD